MRNLSYNHKNKHQMKRINFSLLALLCILTMSCNGIGSKNSEQLLLLGNVITMDSEKPEAEAVLVKDGLIAFVGSKEEALKLCDSKTTIKDYGEASIYPGLMESHAHGIGAASRYLQADLSSVNAMEGTTMDDFVQTMKKYMEENPGLPLYKGAGWTPKDKEPTAAMLDAICPDVPMLLNTEDGHSMWINTAAMKQFGIDASAVQKYGTDCIRVDKDGNPTGYLSETPAIALLGQLSMSKEEAKKGLLKWQEKAFSCGFTATTEAALFIVTPFAAEAYQELCDEGKWKLRTYAVHTIGEDVPDEDVDSALNDIMELHKKYNGEYFKVTGTKVFMDGVVEAHTGWLDEEYSDQPGYFGLKRCPEVSRVAKIVAFNNRNGMLVHFHAVGDGASRVVAEGIAQAAKETDVMDGRNAVAHLQLVKPEIIRMFAEYNIIPVVAPLWSPKEPILFDYTVKYIGKDRAESQYPIKSFIDAGCKINFHSDFPVSPAMDAPKSIYTAVTRTRKDLGPDYACNLSEAITRQQALEAMTNNVAYSWHEEDRMGSIAPGKIANFAIFNTNFLKDDLDALWDAQLQATYVDGKVVYGE